MFQMLAKALEQLLNQTGLRRWTASEKIRVVEETFEPGKTVILVAHGVSPNSCYVASPVAPGGPTAAGSGEEVGRNRHRPLVNCPDTSENLKTCGGPHPLVRRRAMGDPEIGWIAAIIIGGIAGWLAERFMKSDMGLLVNIVLGIVGAAIASAIFGFFGIALGGWIGYLIAGFIGACLLIWLVRALRGRTA
jgi:uncharacterized membrane protein YeaQ/YmgE (transglycosylase-associated protein family)